MIGYASFDHVKIVSVEVGAGSHGSHPRADKLRDQHDLRKYSRKEVVLIQVLLRVENTSVITCH